MQFNVIPLSKVFNDIAQTIISGFECSDIESKISNNIDLNASNIILGSHLLSDWSQIPANSIIYNLEQLGSNSIYITDEYISKLSEFQVWDYSQNNIDWLLKNTKTINPILVPIGYSADLKRISNKENQDIDILFYGWINDRRQKIIDSLVALGLKVIVLTSVFGEELDDYISRSKVILNIHYYDKKIFEIIRVSYLLTNNKAVVTELDDETEIDNELREAVVGATYEKLVNACIEVLNNDELRRRKENHGFSIFSKRNESQYLKNAVNAMKAKKLKSNLVSVVVPCYNQSEYLFECVESVFNQTHSNFEIIIIDDGSSDQTKQVAHRLIDIHKDKKITYLYQNNSGVAKARNYGIQTAQGKYILPLDADDKLHAEMIEKTLTVLLENTHISIAYTDYQHFGDVDLVVETQEYNFKTIAYEKCQFTVTALFRKDAWIKCGGYRYNMIWGAEDWDFWINCGNKGYVGKRVPEVLFYYRTRLSAETRIKIANQHSDFLGARLILNNKDLYDVEKVSWAQKKWASALQYLLNEETEKLRSKVYIKHLEPIELVTECQILESLGQDNLVIKIYEDWLELREADLKFAIYFNLAVAYQRIGEFDMARKNYQLTLKDKPDFIQASTNLAAMPIQ